MLVVKWWAAGQAAYAYAMFQPGGLNGTFSIGKLCENVPVRHMRWDDAWHRKGCDSSGPVKVEQEGFQGFQGDLRAWVLLVDSRAEVLIPEK